MDRAGTRRGRPVPADLSGVPTRVTRDDVSPRRPATQPDGAGLPAPRHRISPPTSAARPRATQSDRQTRPETVVLPPKTELVSTCDVIRTCHKPPARVVHDRDHNSHQRWKDVSPQGARTRPPRLDGQEEAAPTRPHHQPSAATSRTPRPSASPRSTTPAPNYCSDSPPPTNAGPPASPHTGRSSNGATSYPNTSPPPACYTTPTVVVTEGESFRMREPAPEP